MDTGYIKLWRKLKHFDWYKEPNVLSLWIHILIRANYEDVKWKGEQIDRGSFITSLNSLSYETGLSIQQVRTALDKLEITNNITNKSTNKYRTITVINYNEYQCSNKQDDNQITINQQTNNNKEELKEIIEVKEVKKKEYYADSELNELFIDFLSIRKKLKAVNSDRAITTILNKLEPLSLEQKKQCITASIESSWKTIYTDKYNKQQPTDEDDYFKKLNGGKK